MKKRNYLILLLAAFSISATFVSCKKDGDDDDNNDPALTVNTPYSATGTVDGTQINYSATGSISWDAAIQPAPDGSSFVFGSTVFSSAVNDFPSLTVSLGNLFYQDNDFENATLLHNYVTTGANAFTFGIPQNSSTTNKKVAVSYTDSNENTWTTTEGSQTGSTFEITEAVKTTVFGIPIVKYKAKFNCKVYDGNGNSKTLNITKFIGEVDAWN